MKKLLFILLLISSASFADWGDVYYCQMNTSVSIDVDGTVRKHKLEKFQFKLDETKKSMVFGKSDYFGNTEILLDLDMSYPSNEIWIGTNPFYTLGFKGGEFMYSAIVMNLGIDSVVADCDKF